MEKAELMKAGAQDYIHDLACKIADSLEAGDMEEERDYNRALHTTIQAYLEAGVLTEAEATQPVCEAYQESFSKAEEPKVVTAGRDELLSGMRKIALDDLYSAYEEAAKARSKENYLMEKINKTGAEGAAAIYMKLGIISEEDCQNQYVVAYRDYGVAPTKKKAANRPADVPDMHDGR